MGVLSKISGPVIQAEEMRGSQINELVKVGDMELTGEIIALKQSRASIQVYEETSGLRPGEKVVGTGSALSVELGPGLLGGVFDGIQRPLDKIKEKSGNFIARGISVPSLDRKKEWDFNPTVKKGDTVEPGDVLGEVKEYDIIHRILVPVGVKGKITEIKKGKFTVTEDIAVIGGKKVQMMQKWPVRSPRQYKDKKHFEPPLVTGKRIVDSFFPIAKGGTAAIPGPFGSGKTVTQTDLAKYADADIIIYIGCGERGNELSEVLQEFPKLKDPRTGLPLMNRTVMIANTSNMPVAAREASIYTGITIAEYYRDMGYDVALMADSTSRWAEAMREISGRMEEMPGEEGYPAYLGKKLAEFYERSGRVNCLGSDKKDGSISVIGAVSPPGGDLSEPVSQATLRVTKVFWALDANLARRRHYPAINWLRSYSLYLNELKEWYGKNVAEDFLDLRGRAMVLLQKEAELQNIVQLIGPDALPDKERLVLEATKMIREDFLQQNSYDEADAFTPPKKQYEMLKTIMHFYYKAADALSLDVPLSKILEAKEIDEIAKMKRVPPEEMAKKAKAIREGIDRHMAK
ncbi:V-type ATP synthase subunit A [Candidatus Micrarchaeota archaeon CG1_02_55_22]|nr:MAG: V-type ATP synthase subunit A [Candidatus Micrarchaeota archaeon CG1_02_55_22]